MSGVYVLASQYLSLRGVSIPQKFGRKKKMQDAEGLGLKIYWDTKFFSLRSTQLYKEKGLKLFRSVLFWHLPTCTRGYILYLTSANRGFIINGLIELIMVNPYLYHPERWGRMTPQESLALLTGATALSTDSPRPLHQKVWAQKRKAFVDR